MALSKVFKEIYKQTQAKVIYFNGHLNDQARVDVNFHNTPIDDVMSYLLKGRKLSWGFNGKNIVIKPSKFTYEDAHKIDTLYYVTISGRVTDPTGAPLVGATVLINDSTQGIATDKDGRFNIKKVPGNSSLVVSYMGFESQQIRVKKAQADITVKLQPLVTEMNAVTIISTGYQKVPKERATGSFVKVDNELLNRKVSTNILDRLEGVTSGLLFNKTGNRVGNDPGISIRGRSTIFAETSPLIVLDNFPYTGDINNINPNDIESITVLKDAAAASIWGAFSGNGVIVITTKKGKLNQEPTVSFNSNVTIGHKPDLFYQPQLTSKEFIEVEKYLFEQGYYDFYLTFPSYEYYPISSVIDILDRKKRGLLSPKNADAQIAAMEDFDIRKNLQKYFYRESINQQYAVNIRGGGQNQQYYISGGYDKNISDLVGNSLERFTLNASNTYLFLNNKLQINSDILFTKSKTKRSQNYTPRYPYERAADEHGNALPVVSNLRKSYVDTVGEGKLLDWSYRPLEERESNDITDLTDYRINIGIGYNISKNIKASLQYQYGKGYSESNLLYNQSSYYARDLINSYSQLDDASNTVIRPVPLGDILIASANRYTSQYARGQINFDKDWGQHSIAGIAAVEIKDYNSHNSTSGLYGYNPETGAHIPVDYVTIFNLYYGGEARKIEDRSRQFKSIDRFRSYLTNIAYTYKSKYTISASARRDESNLFGVKANQKGVPLWSIGASWDLSQESFYRIQWLPFLKLRVTNGYNGNVDRKITAFTTAREESNTNFYGDPMITIINPPNPSLRWERVNVTNIGIDFRSKNNILSGSIEAYRKRGTDLIGNRPIAPQTGIIEFRGNSASLETKGIDVELNSRIVDGKLKWNATLLFSYVKDKVLTFKDKPPSIVDYITSNYYTPIEGRPYSSLFSFKYGGLDSKGNPQGYLNGKLDQEYSQIINSTTINDLVFHGTQSPTVFGSLRNSFTLGRMEMSFNIIYKLNYYFRRQSLNNAELYSVDPNYLMADYNRKWQKPGDERLTYVPALIYPGDPNRDKFYQYSDVLVERGDHVRLQDIQVAYNIRNNNSNALFSSMKLYLYVNNIGVIWRRNKFKIDPDAVIGYPTARTYAVGLNVDF